MIKIVDESNYYNFTVGAKAYNLFLAKANGIPVPQMFVLSREALVDSEMAATAEKYISTYFNETPLFSVRSASLLEDGVDTSFAGQFDTFLNVSPEEVVESIYKCQQSLYSENVLEYCKQKNISAEDLEMTVIVQKMIRGDVSGVMFTANPQGLLNETVIVVGKGTGDGIVEERVPTTTYYYNTTDKIGYYESQESAPEIEKATLDELIEYCNQLKNLFGSYIDIEFTIEAGKIYILQIRPITTLNTESQTILDNSNIVESYPGITLPLTQSFIEYAYYGVFKGLAYRCLKNRKLVEKYDDTFKQMVGSANGRVYYKISNWYTVIKFLPFSKKIIPIWQEMMGVSNKEHDNEKNDISWYQRVMVYVNSIYEALHVQSGMKKLNESFNEVENLFYDKYNEDMRNTELIKLYDGIGEAVLKNWDITLLNDMYSFVFTALLKRKMKKSKLENYEEETNKYISGITNIESMKPVRAMVSLAKMALDTGAVKSLKTITDDSMINAYLDKNQTEFVNKFKEYIRLYGDRTVEELKLETKTFRSSPVLLIKKILEYAEDSSKLNAIYEALKSEKPIENISTRAMKGIKNREISRLNRSRIYGMVRTIFLTIGRNLAKEGKLDTSEDIFYITVQEVFAYIHGRDYDFRKIIKDRKENYEFYKNLPAYSRLIFAGKEFNKSSAGINLSNGNENKNDRIMGTPCSNGEVTGEVIVIEDPKADIDVKDKILVTKMTDPGWVFMLTMAKGIIAEKGSLLSHTAIISRELGIPSIVGVKGITELLKSGDIITMNGSTGEIERCKNDKNSMV